MSAQQQPPSIEQLLSQKRNEIVIFSQKGPEISLKHFDNLALQIIQLGKLIVSKSEEIKNLKEENKKLKELCEKKIEPKSIVLEKKIKKNN